MWIGPYDVCCVVNDESPTMAKLEVELHAVAVAFRSMLVAPKIVPKTSGVAFPLLATRRAVTRTALALLRADPLSTVNVRTLGSHVPNSTSLVASITTELPSAVLRAPQVTAAFCAAVTP